MMIDDRDLSRIRYPAVCSYCRHYDRESERRCAAFPEEGSIPEAIWRGDNPHTEAYPGDGGIRYEPQPGRPEHPADVDIWLGADIEP